MSQNESLRLVDFTAGGRPFGVLDLEDGQFFSKLKDTMQIRPGQRTVSMSRLPGRFGGSRAVGAREENAEVAWTCAVVGASEDEALRKAGELLSRVADMSAGRRLEFRARGATYPTFLDVRGPGVATPAYDAQLLDQQNAFLVELALPVAPLGEQHRMDVLDDFTDDTRGDYTFDAATSADVGSSGAALIPVVGAALTVERRARHTARGYTRLEGRSTRKFTPGATIAGFKGGVTGRASASTYVDVYVDDDGVNSRLRTDIVIAGVRTNRASVNLAARVVNGTPFWVRRRIVGNVVFAEHFTSSPTPMGAPTTVAPAGGAGYTLSAGEITALVAGHDGWSWVPQHAAATMDDYTDEPFTRRNLTLPARVAFTDTIPGDAPALVDLHVTPSGGAAAPVWALFGWTARPGNPMPSAVVPFGPIEAETADALTTWAVTADTDYRGGSGLQLTAAGAGTGTAEFRVDPSALTPDPFTLCELDLEVWVRSELASTLVSPKLVLSAKPELGTSFGSERFSSPFGSQGKLLVKPSSGTVFRPVRLGTLTVVCDPKRAVMWRIKLAGSWAAGSTGTFGLDQLLLVVAGQRAYSPTGRANDASFPKFVPSTSETTKVVGADLSGALAQPPGSPFPDHGLGGEPLELPSGLVDVLLWLSSVVPDDPTSNTASEQEDYFGSLHLSVVPRVHLLRG